MVGEAAWFGRFPAQHGFFAGVNVGQTTAAKRTCGGVKVDVVLHLAVNWVAQREFDHVVFMNDDQRTGNGSIIS